MEDDPIEFLRFQVESHYVETVLRSLESFEVESLTVRNVQETWFGPGERAATRAGTIALTQVEIFSKRSSREAIVSMIRDLRYPVFAELTCQDVRMRKNEIHPRTQGSHLRFDSANLSSVKGSLA